MPQERRHEADDLGDYEVRDGSETLQGAPGDDPLERGVATPERWSAGMKFGSTASEQETGESLDQHLAEEEPDVGAESDDDRPDRGWDENATDEDVARLAHDLGSDPRSGRLVAEDEGEYAPSEDELVAFDAGVDGGGASAEEAAVHVQDDEEEPG